MPYATYLVFGYILDSKGDVVPDSSIEVKTSIGNKYYASDSNGLYLFDLADIGYASGETVSMDIVEPYNNEYKDHTFTISGDYHEENITLTVRTEAVRATDYSPKTILHSVGKKPITDDNPLPIKIIGQSDVIDLINNPSHTWEVTNGDGQPDSETVTLANGDIYKRTFTYSTVNGMRILTTRSKWVRQ